MILGGVVRRSEGEGKGRFKKDPCGEGREWKKQETDERDVVCLLVLLPAMKVRAGVGTAVAWYLVLGRREGEMQPQRRHLRSR